MQEWLARDQRRSAPELDYGTRWTSPRWPGAEWRVSWNTGTGEVYAARRDRTDPHVLGIAKTFVEVETALQGWGARCDRPGGLEWVFERTHGLSGEGELSIQLARLRAELKDLTIQPEPLGRPGLSVER